MVDVTHEKEINSRKERGKRCQHLSTYMRNIVIDQKSIEIPQPAVAKVQTDNPTPISLKGLWLQKGKNVRTKNEMKEKQPDEYYN